jgi:hypothetical protein
MTWNARPKPDAPVPAALMRHIIWPAMRDGAERRRRAAIEAPPVPPPTPQAPVESVGFLPFPPPPADEPDLDARWTAAMGAIAIGCTFIALVAWLEGW